MKALVTQVQSSQLHGLALRASSFVARPFVSRGLASVALIASLLAPGAALAQPAPAPSTESPDGEQSAPPDQDDQSAAESSGNAAGAPGQSASPEDETRSLARSAYFAGKTAYAAGDFAEAEKQFAYANSLIAAIQAQYWHALSLHEQGKTQEALAALGKIVVHPDRGKLRSEQLKDAAARHEQLKALPTELLLQTQPSGARITVNGQTLPTVSPIALRLAPGRHEILVELPGYASQRFQVNAQPAAKVTHTVVLVSSNPAPSQSSLAPTDTLTGLSAPAPVGLVAADPYSPRQESLIPALTTLGIAGVGAVVGTLFGLRALDEKKKFNASPSVRAADDTERNALIADMALGVAVTLGVTGAVLLATRSAGGDGSLSESPGGLDTARSTFQLIPYAGRSSAGAAARLEF